MEKAAPEKTYCSDLSLEAEEPLAGTATLTTSYLLLEYNGVWGEKALDESDIPAELKSRLKVYGKSNPQAKVLLIRSTRSLIQPGIRFFVVRSDDLGRALYDFHVAGYEDLLDLEIDSILAGDDAYASFRRDAPIYLVCTNGRRDRCCARHGVGVFDALLNLTQKDSAFSVWQCSHIGGHRFAANLYCLPSGLLYGRMRAVDVPALLAADRDRRIYLPNLRGRASYPPAAQAAEVALRRKLGEDRLSALWLTRMEENAPQAWRITFQTNTRKSYAIDVRAEPTEREVYESCTLDKVARIRTYTFDIHEVGIR